MSKYCDLWTEHRAAQKKIRDAERKAKNDACLQDPKCVARRARKTSTTTTTTTSTTTTTTTTSTTTSTTSTSTSTTTSTSSGFLGTFDLSSLFERKLEFPQSSSEAPQTEAQKQDSTTPAPRSRTAGGGGGNGGSRQSTEAADTASAEDEGNDYNQQLFFSADDSRFSFDGRNAGFDSSQWNNDVDDDAADQASWLKLKLEFCPFFVIWELGKIRKSGFLNTRVFGKRDTFRA